MEIPGVASVTGPPKFSIEKARVSPRLVIDDKAGSIEADDRLFRIEAIHITTLKIDYIGHSAAVFNVLDSHHEIALFIGERLTALNSAKRHCLRLAFIIYSHFNYLTFY
jgi:hypothetical protein